MASAFPSRRPISDKALERISVNNPGVRYERSAEGELIVTPPTRVPGGRAEGKLFSQLEAWAERDGRGFATPATTGLKLPNKAVYAPDAAWILSDRWNALSEKDRKGFGFIAPDVAFELLSENDDCDEVREKAKEYIANGTRLVVLLDPRSRSVELHRPGVEIEPHRNIETLALDPELPGFCLNVKVVFDLADPLDLRRPRRSTSESSNSRRL